MGGSFGAYTAPPTGFPEPYILSTFSAQCMGPVCNAITQTTPTSQALTQNFSYFYPFTLTTGRTYTGVIWMNGATVNGNIIAAVYSLDLTTALATIALTAQSGTTAPQQVAFTTPLALAPGQYWLAVGTDSATATMVCKVPTASVLRANGCRIWGNVVLTGSAVAATGMSQSRVPLIGLYEASWL